MHVHFEERLRRVSFLLNNREKEIGVNVLASHDSLFSSNEKIVKHLPRLDRTRRPIAR